MSTKLKTRSHVAKGIRFTALLVLIGLVLSLFVFPFSVSAVGTSGWVEIRASVPEGFEDTIIATFVQEETYEEYALRVMAINDYVTIEKLPAGNYVFDGAFLESSDFRYNTNLINEADHFEVSADPNAAAVLIELETVYNEEYKDGAGTPPTEVTEPVTEATVPVSEPSEDVVEPSETEAPEETESVEETEPSEVVENGFTLKDKLVRFGIGTGIFIAVVFLVAFLLRRYTKNN